MEAVVFSIAAKVGKPGFLTTLLGKGPFCRSAHCLAHYLAHYLAHCLDCSTSRFPSPVRAIFDRLMEIPLAPKALSPTEYVPHVHPIVIPQKSRQKGL